MLLAQLAGVDVTFMRDAKRAVRRAQAECGKDDQKIVSVQVTSGARTMGVSREMTFTGNRAAFAALYRLLHALGD